MKRSLLYGFTTVLVTGSCALLVVATETWLRYQDRARASIYVADDGAIARFKPNLKRERTPSGKPIPLATNRYGIRDDTDLNPSLADILIVGDSNVTALYLPFEKTLGERIEKELGGNLGAANLAVPGYGPDQSANRVLSIADVATARAVVFHFFADNDFGDLFRNNIYRQMPSGEWVTREHLGKDPMLVWNKYKVVQRAWQFAGMSRQRFDRLVAGDTYYSRAWRGKRDKRSEYERYVQGQYTSWMGDHYDWTISADPTGVIASEAQKALVHVLSKTADAFKGKPSCLVFVIQPSENDLLRNSGFNPPGLASIRDSKGYYPRALVDLAIGAARKADIAFIDLFPVFATDPEAFYYPESVMPRDNHWNETGIAETAVRVAEYLRDAECFEGLGRSQP